MQIALRPPIRLETDEDLVRVSRDNPGYTFEREEDGTIVVSPTSTPGGAKSGEAFGQLRDYAKVAGGKTYDSNAGFGVPSRDAPSIRTERNTRRGTVPTPASKKGRRRRGRRNGAGAGDPRVILVHSRARPCADGEHRER